jgi:hypothetical protein
MPRKQKPSGRDARLKAVVVGLLAVAAIAATASSAGSHESTVAASDPARCVVLKVVP